MLFILSAYQKDIPKKTKSLLFCVFIQRIKPIDMFKRQLLLLLMFIGLGHNAQAQLKSNTEFNTERFRINKSGLVVLSSWAAVNITAGSIGWATAKGERKYFNQMNVFWNIVNLGIALPGLIKSK